MSLLPSASAHTPEGLVPLVQRCDWILRRRPVVCSGAVGISKPMRNERHQILNDNDFWSRLEFAACRWLAASDDSRSSRIWIDGFLPESITDTRLGADVEGVAWLTNGSRQQALRFVASIPQKLLQSNRENVVLHAFHLDEDRRLLELAVDKKPHLAKEPGSHKLHPDTRDSGRREA